MLPSLVIADDHALVRRALARSLQYRGFHVVAEASDGAEAVAYVRDLRPSVALFDRVMTPVDGLDATRRLTVVGCSTPIVIMSGFHDEHAAREAVGVGASAYVSKSDSLDELVSTLRRVVRASQLPPDPIAALSTRECEVLALIADGHDRSQISAHLGITPRTVDAHRKSILKKLGVTSIAEAARAAERAGIVRASR